MLAKRNELEYGVAITYADRVVADTVEACHGPWVVNAVDVGAGPIDAGDEKAGPQVTGRHFPVDDHRQVAGKLADEAATVELVEVESTRAEYHVVHPPFSDFAELVLDVLGELMHRRVLELMSSADSTNEDVLYTQSVARRKGDAARSDRVDLRVLMVHSTVRNGALSIWSLATTMALPSAQLAAIRMVMLRSCLQLLGAIGPGQRLPRPTGGLSGHAVRGVNSCGRSVTAS